MGGNWDQQYWKIYLDEETREKISEIKHHLEDNFDGPSDFVQNKIHEEKPLSIEERIRRKENKIQDEKNNLEQLKQVRREREEQDKLRDKKELLKEKQKKLRQISNKKTTRESIREKVKEEILERKPERLSEQEFLEKKKENNAIERRVDSRLESIPDVDSLVENVQRLQKQVAELNDGREDWFMDLESIEVKA